MLRRALALLFLSVLALTAPAQDSYNAFVADLQRSMEFKDDKVLDKSLKQNTRSAIFLYYALAREWKFGQPDVSEKARAKMDAMLASWKRVFKGETLDKVERFYSAVEGAALKQLDTNSGAFEQAQRTLADARAGKKRLELEQCRESFWKLADLYEKIGHNLLAAEAWECAAVALHSLPDATLQERRDAVFALERYKELRESWQFTDEVMFQQNMAWLKATKADIEASEKVAKDREARGVKGDAKGPDAVVDPKATEIIADLHFEVMKGEIDDCFISGGPVPPNWQVIELKKEDPAQLLYFQASQLFAVRSGGKMMVWPVADQAAKSGVVVTPAAKPKPSQFWLDEKKTKPYAMWFFAGTDKEPFMGLQQNLLATDDRALVYYKSAASWKATVNGEEITLFDSNADGKLFTPDPYAFRLELVTTVFGKPAAVPAYDSMIVGKKGTVQPFSGFAKVGAGWFHLRAAKDGTAISARPVIAEFFKTGTLTLKWTGPKTTTLQSLVVRGEGDLSVAAFNLASGKPIEVPAGMYSIDYGRILEGKGGVYATADIFRGKSEAITVKAGENKVISVGAPFVWDFEKSTSGADLEINTHKLVLQGVAGEHYGRLNSCVPDTEVVLAKDDKGKGAKVVATLGAVPDSEVATKLNTEFPDGGYGYWAPMFPIIKGVKDKFTALRIPAPGDGVVGLRSPKAKLFGVINPVWK